MYRWPLSKRHLDLLARAVATACASLVVSATGTNAQTDEDFFHIGVIEYEVASLPCHGIEGVTAL